MLLVNTLQQPSRTMMLHLVKIPLLMLLLTELFFFFFQFILLLDPKKRVFFNKKVFVTFYPKNRKRKSSSLSHVACGRSQWACFQAELFVFNWYKQVESSLHRYFQVRIASANPRRVDSPPFVSLLNSSSLAFIIFLFVFLWVQRCNLHYLFVFFCFSSFPFCVYRHCSLSILIFVLLKLKLLENLQKTEKRGRQPVFAALLFEFWPAQVYYLNSVCVLQPWLLPLLHPHQHMNMRFSLVFVGQITAQDSPAISLPL